MNAWCCSNLVLLIRQPLGFGKRALQARNQHRAVGWSVTWPGGEPFTVRAFARSRVSCLCGASRPGGRGAIPVRQDVHAGAPSPRAAPTRERANARTRERANARTRERENARTRERADHLARSAVGQRYESRSSAWPGRSGVPGAHADGVEPHGNTARPREKLMT